MSSDEAESVAKIARWLQRSNRTELIAGALRNAIDYVLDGTHTGRYDIRDLDKIEKTFIGLKAEHFVMHDLGLNATRIRGQLDTVIEDEPIDIKFSLATDWMIPREAVGHLCLLLSANDLESKHSIGVFLAEDAYLGSENRDGKRSILSHARENHVHWVARHAPLPENILLHLSDENRTAIFSHRYGQQRVLELFRRVKNQPIPKKVLSTVAQQDEPRARARDAARVLKNDGIFVYTHLKNDKAESYGLPRMSKGWWMAGTVDVNLLLADPDAVE